MRRILLPNCWLCCLTLIAFITPSVPASSFELEIETNQNKLSVKADQVPLQMLLQRVSDFGIKVNIDPAINPLITASLDNHDLEEGLKSILRPLNHIFVWKHSKGADQLSEIQVFKPGQRDRMIQLDETPDMAAEQVPKEEIATDGDRETKVIIKGNRVYVPVILGYKGRKLETTLIFDTGAGDIVIHEDVAGMLGVDDVTRAKGRGVGGVEIDALVGRLDSVKVGPYEKQNLRTAIVTYNGPEDDQYNGLLGMNFLRGLRYDIDFDKQVIRWPEEINGQSE